MTLVELSPLLRSPRLPDYVATLTEHMRIERAARDRFRDEMSEDDKVEFINGVVVVQPPTMNRHMTLSKFGCIGTGPTPAHPDGVPEPDPATCAPPPAIVTTTIPTAPAPEPSTTTNSLPSTSSTQPPVTTSVPCPPPSSIPEGEWACAF